jgi:hypothetical protein
MYVMSQEEEREIVFTTIADKSFDINTSSNGHTTQGVKTYSSGTTRGFNPQKNV